MEGRENEYLSGSGLAYADKMAESDAIKDDGFSREPTLKEIRDGIADAEARADELRAQLSEAHERELSEFAMVVRNKAEARGISLESVIGALSAMLPAHPYDAPVKLKRFRKPRKTSDGETEVKRRIWRDVLGNEYRGGPAPAWMRTAMESHGIDKTREFCKKHLTLVE